MNLFFIADIFLGRAAGIHRYSLEMARRLMEDEEVRVKFVCVGEASINALDRRLRELFGQDTRIHDRRVMAGIEFDGRLLMQCTQLHEKLKLHIRAQKKSWLKPLREVLRVLRKIEESLLGLTHFRYGAPKPVLFSPYHATGSLMQSRDNPFLVHVVHDVIPVIHPEYFEANKGFHRIYARLTEADLIITVSESTRQDLINHHDAVEPERIHTVAIAASAHFQPVDGRSDLSRIRRKYGIPEDSDYILTLCTMEPRKNHLRLLEAWAKVVEKLELKSPKLVIAGGAGWGEGLQDGVHQALGNSDSIITTGYVDDDDLPLLYSGCAFSVYPSLYEGFGLPVLESMKCGRFCLTSNVSSMPEITGEDLPLVDPQDVDSIAAGILNTANDTGRRKELEHRAIERAKLFSWDSCHRHTIHLIRAKAANP